MSYGLVQFGKSNLIRFSSVLSPVGSGVVAVHHGQLERNSIHVNPELDILAAL